MNITVLDTQPTIRSGRFTLRPPRISDAGLMRMYTSDERVARATASIPHPLPPGATEAFIERAMTPGHTEDCWVIDGSATEMGEVVGVISLKRMDRLQSEIGYWVAPSSWNTGVASETVKALISANPQGCCTIFASVFQDNPASARVLTNAGFNYIGDAETYSVSRGATVPTWTYSLKLD
ncbi:GNAT family N-acetyltransferase [Profundibacterium mesophilum]|uniref:Phospholipiddiacylglycerol acyltransferase n=1 Tax=Profundibacterium mesophilum KAUST100406-0324 TaxID=1037889 RepID=A0A921TC27_9RHOB|nr:GNAT family N-acetyltransferase [Profundibacterium mesophilum]KAF0675178.1 phospholipiddiacylglycerol acyltransferase [Profundibacterium mesophilum KAUST100406-0324]